jgi:hypothetical protein
MHKTGILAISLAWLILFAACGYVAAHPTALESHSPTRGASIPMSVFQPSDHVPAQSAQVDDGAVTISASSLISTPGREPGPLTVR